MCSVEVKRIITLFGCGGRFGNGILQGIGEYARRRDNWDICNIAYFEPNLAETLADPTIAGVIGYSERSSRDVICDASRAPLVNVVESPESDVPCICLDNRAAATCAADVLLAMHAKQFAYVGAADRMDNEVRARAFMQRVASAGPCLRIELEKPWAAAHRRHCLAQLDDWLSAIEPPIGILAFCDDVAGLVIDSARRVGLHVPHEVAVIGIDNDQTTCNLYEPAISSVAPDYPRIGFEAAKLLDGLMRNGQAPTEPVRIAPVGVVERGSTMLADDPHVAQALRYIREHAAEGISVADVSKAVAISPRNLQTKFKRCLGHSPSDEIWSVRVGSARRMLIDTGLDLADIAAATGFRSVAHLSRTIKAHTGLSPSTWREQRREQCQNSEHLHANALVASN